MKYDKRFAYCLKCPIDGERCTFYVEGVKCEYYVECKCWNECSPSKIPKECKGALKIG